MPAETIKLGRGTDGKLVRLDIPTLVATRLLIQANSGGGKSWTLRRLLEQSHGKIQHIILDPEGEFASLREKYSYVLTGKGADFASDPQHAAILARRILELGVSVICDLYELKPRERMRFVRLFCEALTNAPKALWHPVLVVIDEAHVYCPEKGDAESTEAVIDLCTRGRKRGICPVLATQRLANLSKQAAAQCLNVLVGQSFLDIDRKRALEILGVPNDKVLNRELMALKPGQFYSIGRALTQSLTLVEIGPVKTHHPEIAGGRRAALSPPPPPDKLKAVLAELADLPREAEEEANEKARLLERIRELQKELRAAKAQQPAVDPAVIERTVQAELRKYRAACDAKVQELQTALSGYRRTLERIARQAAESIPEVSIALPEIPKPTAVETKPRSPEPKPRIIAPVRTASSSNNNDLRAGARRMLEVLCRHYPAKMTKAQLATLSGFSVRGGTFGTYLSDLRRGGYIEFDNGLLRASEEGLSLCGLTAPAPMTTDEILEMWRTALRAGARKMLDLLVEAYPRGMTRNELAEAAGFAVNGGTFGTYLSDLRRNGLIEESGGVLRASGVLFGLEN